MVFGLSYVIIKISRNIKGCVNSRLIAVLSKDIPVIVKVFSIIFWQRIIITNRDRQFVVESVDIHTVAEDMAIKCEQKCKTTGIHTFEESAFAEPHHTCSCA